LGPGHQISLMALAALGAAYRETGRLAEARRTLEGGLALLAAEPDVAIAAVHGEFGLTLLDERDVAGAERMLRLALADYDRAGEQTRWQRIRPRARAASGLGLALAAQGKFAEAESLVVGAFRELEATEKTLAGDRHRLLDDARAAVVQVYTAGGKSEQAATWSNPAFRPTTP
jgi:tetratricopeptide (TPR) repeat protein